MSGIAKNDRSALSPALRVICGFNAVVWLAAQPPWLTADGLATASAIAGAALWATLAIGGNRAGSARHATLVVATVHLALLLSKIIGDRL